jgi:serine/threonine-protein kinase HipA
MLTLGMTLAMIDPDSLNVWYEDKLVGFLWRNATGAIGFGYSREWLDDGNFIISQTLPARAEEYSPEDGIAHRFFGNLLPEGNVREHIVRDLTISNSDFELLRAIGGECAGALSILPIEKTPEQDYDYNPLVDAGLEQLLLRRGHIYTAFPADQRPRLSLAGAQNKCPVLLRDGQYYLPKSEAPSSHILKFEVRDYHHLPAYETYTTLLASQVGLPVVNIDLCQSEENYFAQVQRYDRFWVGNRLTRLHQEDFCQALGYSHDRKYQENGGPSFADCFQLLRDISSDPAVDTLNLLRWQIFNYLAGNSDGHAKNLSLLYTQNGETHLAPFYDLICTRAIERIDYNLAFAIGGQRDPGHINEEHWNEFARQCDVAPRFVRTLVAETIEMILAKLTVVSSLFEESYGKYPALQRIDQIVYQQCRLS